MARKLPARAAFSELGLHTGASRNAKQSHGHTDAVYSVAYSPDGKTVASGSLDSDIMLWDISQARQSGDAQKPIVAKYTGHKDFVLSLAYSVDGGMLVRTAMLFCPEMCCPSRIGSYPAGVVVRSDLTARLCSLAGVGLEGPDGSVLGHTVRLRLRAAADPQWPRKLRHQVLTTPSNSNRLVAV